MRALLLRGYEPPSCRCASGPPRGLSRLGSGPAIDLRVKVDFLEDKRTQQAVIMSLIILGEAATKVMDGYAEFTLTHPEIPWRSMRGMRNRIAHGYFDINLDVVWDTVQTALPDLLSKLTSVRRDAK
jgi:uncharacterized protein with HEPN domain